MRRGLVLMALLACAACVPEAGTAPDEPVAMTGAEKAACIGAGGKIAIAGIFGGEFCAERMPDAGQACTRAGDCTGFCEAETRTCSTHNNPFGCRSYLDDAGAPQMICAD